MSTDQSRSRSRRVTLGAAAALTAGLALTTVLTDRAAGSGWQATAELHDVSGRRVGRVRFDGDDAGTEVKVTVNGLAAGLDAYHGLHIHRGDGTGRCDAATGSPFSNVGGHWSMGTELHGHHDGDLPPVLVQLDGSGTARSTTGRFEPSDLVGRAVVLHAGPDNLANIPVRYSTPTWPVPGPDDVTTSTGDAGGRLACGVIVGG